MSHITKAKASINVTSGNAACILEKSIGNLGFTFSSEIGFKIKDKTYTKYKLKEKKSRHNVDLLIDEKTNEVSASGDFWYTQYNNAKRFINELTKDFIKETVIDDLEEKGYELDETEETEEEIVWTFN